MDAFTFFGQYSQTSSDGGGMGGYLLAIIFGVIYVVTMWRVFEKAKKPGWAAIVPIYNIYVTLKIVGRPGWWLLLYFVPLVNVVVHAIVSVDIAKVFGKSTAFGIIGIWLFSAIGYLILAFGDATYKGAPNRTAS